MPTAWVERNKRGKGGTGRNHGGWTFVELMAVIILVGVMLLIGGLSIYRGKAASEQLSCQDNMRAIHSALQIYWEKNQRTYPVGQAAFEQFLAQWLQS
jgi:type II secretory pathway pseudopilin PulG